MYQNTSLYKSTKVGLDTTLYSTCTGTILGNTNSFNQNYGCKINQAYQKAVNLIDDLINVMQEKKEISRIGAKNVGYTNQNVLQLWKEYQAQRRNCYQSDNNYVKQEFSEVDLDKLQLLKVIQAQKEQNKNLYRKCHNLSNQNIKLRQSQVTGLYSRVYNSYALAFEPIQYQNNPNYETSSSVMSSRLFSQLQNLKAQNQYLKQQTIKLLQNSRQ